MARSRNIKPSIFKNELLGEADPLLTILFQGLWCLADRDGKLEDRPKRIKAEIFPYRELPDFNGYLTVLARLGFIDRYEVGGTAIIKVLNFAKHQSPHKTEKGSDLPDNPIESDSCPLTVKAPLNNETVTEEAALIPDSLIPDSLCNTAQSKKPKKRKSRLPEDYELTEKLERNAQDYWLTKNRKDLDPAEEFSKFKNYYLENQEAANDWSRKWTTWYTNAIQFNRSIRSENGKPTIAAIARHHATDTSWLDQ
jgi:hypothetical protein